ncbi:MAG: acetyl-CoA carboxylase biotin carboxyl carrier protein subunit [Tannerellaceae bacterium]|jgi:biotin carboxyl carrier protein|nr:acetyl-CoA carboxylase biotin carboxyl carrier protein subunit [Tannerellaceae bacterium]
MKNLETQDKQYVDFIVTARKYKTLLTNKYINRPVWSRRIPGEVRSTLPGTIAGIAVGQGQEVEEGELLITLEAMKMQNRIIVPVTGTVSEIYVKEGDKISKNHLMLKITPK